MPGTWFWLFVVSVLLLLAFAITVEFVGARWYTWTMLALGLMVYAFAVVAYIVRGRSFRGSANEEEADEEVPQKRRPAPVSAKKPARARPMSARQNGDF